MHRSLSMLQLGLVAIFLSRSLTRAYQQRAIDLRGAAGAKAAVIAGSGVVPVRVSVIALLGWAMSLVSATALLLT